MMPSHAVDSDGSTTLPRVGVISAWMDPEDPRVWSGVPARMIEQLRGLGVYAGHRDVTPFLGPARLVHRWMRLTGRTDAWVLRREMRALGAMSDRVRRQTGPAGVDGWIHLVGANGPAVRGKYVTFFEMSPSQLRDAALAWPDSLGYPPVTRAAMDHVARRQHALHHHAVAACVASRWAADSLVRDHGLAAANVHVVGYGRNVRIPCPAERDWSEPRLLFVGRDWRRKNGDAVVRAFVRLRRELPSARLEVVGNHPPLDVEGVVGHGPIGFYDAEGLRVLESLFAAATCFVLPSRFEPFGIVYVEAAAAGIASVAGIHGGTRDSVGDGGVLVDPADDDAILRALRRVADPSEAAGLGAIARRRAGAFEWAHVARRTVRSFGFAGFADEDVVELP